MVTFHTAGRTCPSISYWFCEATASLTALVWLTYDRTFWEHAAATNVVDWSSVKVQLYNLHAAEALARGRYELPSDSLELISSSSSQVVSRSWNRGRLSIPYTSCRFAHRRSSCLCLLLHCLATMLPNGVLLLPLCRIPAANQKDSYPCGHYVLSFRLPFFFLAAQIIWIPLLTFWPLT